VAETQLLTVRRTNKKGEKRKQKRTGNCRDNELSYRRRIERGRISDVAEVRGKALMGPWAKRYLRGKNES